MVCVLVCEGAHALMPGIVHACMELCVSWVRKWGGGGDVAGRLA